MTQDVAVLEAVAGSLVSIAGEAVAERRRLLAERQSLVRVLRDMGGAPPPAGAHPAWAAGGGAAGAGCRWGAARGWPPGLAHPIELVAPSACVCGCAQPACTHLGRRVHAS